MQHLEDMCYDHNHPWPTVSALTTASVWRPEALAHPGLTGPAAVQHAQAHYEHPTVPVVLYLAQQSCSFVDSVEVWLELSVCRAPPLLTRCTPGRHAGCGPPPCLPRDSAPHADP